MPQPRRVLISDVDGTLCFHQEIHGMVPVQDGDPRGEQPLVVQESATGATFHVQDVSTSSYRIFVANETIALMRALRAHFTIVLVTGGRPSTMKRRRPILDFADVVILENGGLIYDAEYVTDPTWWSKLEPERRHLAVVKTQLTNAGWQIDADGRTSAIRVRLRDNSAKTAEEFADLCTNISLPSALSKTINLDNLDIILASAGKANALQYWMSTHERRFEEAVGLGDDINDLEFLELVGRQYIPASAYPETLRQARQRGWYVAASGGISGINEILRRLLEDAEKRSRDES